MRSQGKNRHLPALLAWVLCLLLGGCDTVTRHKVLSTVFDGVPSLPPAEEICEDYQGQTLIAPVVEAATMAGDNLPIEDSSSHRPYAEQRCDDCHDFDKASKLIRPKMELCFVCHKDFVQGTFVHGPVSVGDCLACHVPHDSRFTSLLQRDRNGICDKCHQEKRLAEHMHRRVVSHDMACVDCHDPHYGNARYFLK